MSEIEFRTKNGVTEAGLKELAKPFHESQIDWKIQTVTGDDSKAMVVPYIDSRAVQNRLDEVCGVMNWRNHFTPVKSIESGKEVVNMLCGIAIRLDDLGGEWLCKWDGSSPTQVESFKGVISTSQRRAAVEWAVGRSIYDLELEWVELIQGKGGKCKATFKSKIDGKTKYASFNPPKLPEEYREPADDKPDPELTEANRITGTTQATWEDLLSWMESSDTIINGKNPQGVPLLDLIEGAKKKHDAKTLCGNLLKYFGTEETK